MTRIVAAAVATTQNKTAIVGARRLFVDASETIRRMNLISYAIQSVHKVAGATKLYHNRSPLLRSLGFELLGVCQTTRQSSSTGTALEGAGKLQHKNAKSINSRRITAVTTLLSRVLTCERTCVVRMRVTRAPTTNNFMANLRVVYFSTCNGFAPLVHFVTEKMEQNKFASLGVGH